MNQLLLLPFKAAAHCIFGTGCAHEEGRRDFAIPPGGCALRQWDGRAAASEGEDMSSA